MKGLYLRVFKSQKLPFISKAGVVKKLTESKGYVSGVWGCPFIPTVNVPVKCEPARDLA